MEVSDPDWVSFLGVSDMRPWLKLLLALLRFLPGFLLFCCETSAAVPSCFISGALLCQPSRTGVCFFSKGTLPRRCAAVPLCQSCRKLFSFLGSLKP